MKTLIKYIGIVILGIATMISCDSFMDINTDPTRLKTAQIPQVLPAAQGNLAFNMGLDLFLYSSIFVQQGAGQGIAATQTRTYDQYVVTNTDVNNTFNTFYAGILTDLRYLKSIASGQNPKHVGIAQLMEAFTFSIITDAWGDVPYKEALKGVANVQPQYDASQEIYDSLFITIDQGLANLELDNVLPVAGEDLIYGGDIQKWRNFGYTLKLRLALHYAKVDGGAKLAAIINEVEASATDSKSFMTANTDNFQLNFENVANRQNPYYQFEIQRNDYYAPNAFLVNMMNTKADPRRRTYFTPSPAPVPLPTNPTLGSYQGTVSGDPTVAPYSRLHTFFKGNLLTDAGQRTPNGGVTSVALTYTGAAPVRMLTFAEYNFIRAEAALVYGSPGNAQTFFTEGIRASLLEAGMTATEVSTYLAAQTAGALTLQAIIEEKFVASLGIAIEPWTDWRRTGFPVLAPSAAAVVQGNTTIPRILVYPLNEQQANLANVPARASMVVKGVFWDN